MSLLSGMSGNRLASPVNKEEAFTLQNGLPCSGSYLLFIFDFKSQNPPERASNKLIYHTPSPAPSPELLDGTL